MEVNHERPNQMNAVLKRTPLADEHIRLGARMVDFAGWSMPVLYQGIIEEHKAVRSNVGLFDVSHMGEIWVSGPKSLETLQWLTTNDVSKLKKGQAQYSLLPNENGGLVDDIIIYCFEPGQEYMVCVNASNADKDFEWMMKNNKGAILSNESAAWAQIAVQGPKAIELLTRLFGAEVKETKPFEFMDTKFGDSRALVARTGYTGEDGAEVFVRAEGAVKLWQTLLEKGQDLGVKPIGLGARDTLRTEMKYSLYGHEIDASSNPIEARLGWVVKFEKGDFIGKGPMTEMKAKGPSRALIGFKMVDKGIPREQYPIFSPQKERIGVVTSGTMSPSLGEPIGIGYVAKSFSVENSEIFVEIRGRMAKARVVKTPFVTKST